MITEAFQALFNLIKEGVEAIAGYAIFALISFANLGFSLIQSLFTAVTSLISLPEVPDPPEYVTAVNWFFPIGGMLSIAAPIVIGYASFLLIRWALKWMGEL